MVVCLMGDRYVASPMICKKICVLRQTQAAHMERSKYILAIVALASWAASLLLGNWSQVSEAGLSLGDALVVASLTFAAFASQKWIAIAALPLLLIGSIAGERWRYLLVVIALASWVVMHLLNYVSAIANMPVSVFKAGWIALFCLALRALSLCRWRELVILCLTLFCTFHAFLLTSLVPEPVVLPNRWLQEVGFRIYASHLIRSMPLEAFLSKCELAEYIETDGTKQQVGECDYGLRSTMWFRLLLIYDPGGQIASTTTQRTLAWRLAVLQLPEGRSFVHSNDAGRLVGNVYWFLDFNPDRGDDGKVRLR